MRIAVPACCSGARTGSGFAADLPCWHVSQCYVADHAAFAAVGADGATGAPVDPRGGSRRVPRDVRDPRAAGELLAEYVTRRGRAALEEWGIGNTGDAGFVSRGAALMLSGGVDSIAVAGALRRVAPDMPITAVTVTTHAAAETQGKAEERAEVQRAREAAEIFELDHQVVALSSGEVEQAAGEAMRLLPTRELWEIAAAVTILATYIRLDECATNDVRFTGPVFTGGGADVLLAGGVTAPDAVQSDPMAFTKWFESTTRTSVKRSFTRHRLIPDFYERLLGDRHSSYVEVFQTLPAWQVTRRFTAEAAFADRGGEMFDKACLREAAGILGVPEGLAWTRKNPMQVSSGIVGALARLTRERVRGFPHATTYTDPATEPADNALARVALERIGDHSPTDEFPTGQYR